MSADDRYGAELAKALDAIVEKKASLSGGTLLALGVLAGIYIGFGAVAATTVKSLGGPSPAVTSFLAASVFCVGLVLVIIPGSELFTGNILMTVGLVSRSTPFARVLRNWGLVYLGNFLGALLLAFAIWGAGFYEAGNGGSAFGATAARIAESKIALPFGAAFLRGVLCNMLVCLAVILALSARTAVGKILGIYFPIMVFVLSGFEHSIANMYFLPAGLLAKGGCHSHFVSIFRNLIPVTIGNILGGMLVIVLHPAQARRFLRDLSKI